MPEHASARPRPLRLAVVGAGVSDETTSATALAVGSEIALAGAVLLCGGRSGVMAASAAGARQAGGLTVGILPGADARESPPNPDIELPIFTGLGQARNLVLVLSADAVIAVGGGWGTLSEIALAVKHERPVVLLGSWDLDPPTGIDGHHLHRAEEPREAVATAVRLATSGDPTS